MEQVRQKYPEVAQHLEAIPEHIAEHIGDLALRMTHEDMHPKKEYKTEYGGTRLEADFSELLRDPAVQQENLSQDALEAAEAGEQKLADVLRTSASLLRTSHEELEASGMRFGAADLETDDQRNKRENSEKEAVYDTAFSIAIDAAVLAKQEGNAEKALAASESIVLLQHLRGGESRKQLREAVRAGLADELISAIQEARKLYTGQDYRFVSHEMFEAQPLLEMATGKNLDRDFKVSGEKSYYNQVVGNESIKDLVAVMTSPVGITYEDGLQLLQRSTGTIGEAAAQVDPSKPKDEVWSTEYFYQAVESLEGGYSSQGVYEGFRCDDPLRANTVAKAMGTDPYTIVSRFGRNMGYEKPNHLDVQALEQMQELQKEFPEACKELLYATSLQDQERGGIKYQPAAVLEKLRDMKTAGIEATWPVSVALEFEDTESSFANVLNLQQACEKAGVSIDDVPKLAKATKESTHLLLRNCENPAEALRTLNTLATKAETISKYRELYQKQTFPITERPERAQLDDLPFLKKRLMAVGLPDEVSGEIFKSWATYSGYGVVAFGSGGLPKEQLPDYALETAANDQAKAFAGQVEALETFTEQYGLESTRAIVGTFGIYNFSRHQPEDLALQLKHWQEGTPIKTVVVEARSDWNSFTGKMLTFEGQTGEGAFFFEANSGTGVARIAVQAGKHERSNGREPSIDKFIVHAHGNPGGMLMGVQGERINTEAYLTASRNQQKIQHLEANDYKRHLGEHYQVILQSCSTAGDNGSAWNVAKTISESHKTPVTGAAVTIYGLVITEDGGVQFSSSEVDGSKPITYGQR